MPALSSLLAADVSPLVASSAGAPQRARRGLRTTVAACLLIVVISRLGFLSAPFQNDAGIYIMMGKTLVEGGRLYRDFFETKLPSVALLTAPLYAAFGSSWACYVVLQLALAVAAAFLLARSA